MRLTQYELGVLEIKQENYYTTKATFLSPSKNEHGITTNSLEALIQDYLDMGWMLVQIYDVDKSTGHRKVYFQREVE